MPSQTDWPKVLSFNLPIPTYPRHYLTCSPKPTRLAAPHAAPQLVENWSVGALSPLLHVEPEQERALAAAQAVISRLRRRDLYKFCSEALVPQVGGWQLWLSSWLSSQARFQRVDCHAWEVRFLGLPVLC